MDDATANQPTPIDRYVRSFRTLTAAAKAAGITREQLRKIRKKGYVPTRDRAVLMADACGNSVKAAELLAVQDAA